MVTRSKIKNTLMALSGALLLGSLVQAAPAEAGHRHGWGDGWGGYGRHVVVHRVHRPVVQRVVYVHRPVVYRRPAVRRVVIVERPRYRRYHHVGWHHRVGYRPRWHGRWHDYDRPRCWLPERHLCR